MALPVPNQAAVTIVGTVLAAAGLNLGVLGLVAPETTTDHSTEAPAPAEPVAAETNVAVTHEGLAQVEADASDQVVALPLPKPADMSGISSGSETTQGSDDPLPSGEQVSSSAAPTSQATTAQAAATNGSQERSSDDRSATTAAPASTAQTTAAPTTAAPSNPQPSSTEFLTYEFEGVATIIIALHDGDSLEFWSVARQPGWVSRVDDNEPTKVKVKFMRLSDGEEAEFVVKFDEEDRGKLEVKMEH